MEYIKTIDPYSFSKTVNRFINSLKKHNDCVEVIKVNDKETIIIYEDWEHEPIINFNAISHRASILKNNPMHNPETLAKMMKTKKERYDVTTKTDKKRSYIIGDKHVGRPKNKPKENV